MYVLDYPHKQIKMMFELREYYPSVVRARITYTVTGIMM